MIRNMEYDIDKTKAIQYLEYLEEKYTEWYTHPQQRPTIETEIYEAAMQWDVDFYASLRNGRATGLFESGFFQSDVQEAFERLKEIITGNEF